MGILRLSEKGVLYKIRNKWFNMNGTSCDHNGSADNDGQFDMDAVGGLFVILIVGIIVSFIIGVAEFLWHVHKIALKEKVSCVFSLLEVKTNAISHRLSPWSHLRERLTFSYESG